MRVALVHEWLTDYAGSERVLEAIASLYPDAPIFTLLHDSAAMTATPLGGRTIHTSMLDHLPILRRHHRWCLPLMPFAIEQFDLDEYDLIISSSHAVAKGVLTRADQLHISYVHTPMRYAWDLHHAYLRRHGALSSVRSMFPRALLHYLRLWDLASVNRVDRFIANSNYIARRIAKTYRRDATVIYPPVDVDRFRADQPREDFYLCVGRLVPYKQVDLIVRTFTYNGRPLVVIGNGPQASRLRHAAGENITFLGRSDDATVVDYMQRCRAFVFAADEDFGITAVEAQSAGAPVIAYGHGGSLETIREGHTGLFFGSQTEAGINAAIQKFEAMEDRFDPAAIRGHAEQFSRDRFKSQFYAFVEESWQNFQRERHA